MSYAAGCIPAEEIRRHLSGRFSTTVESYDIVESTNTLARAKAADGAPEGLVIISATQTGGRGRKGRSFFSPDGTGIYMSILLRPEMDAELALGVTTTAAVSVCRAIESLTCRNPGIKWVNDIFIDDRKVCGILTETAFGAAAGRPDYVVLGIGVNASEPKGGFPEEIRSIAGSVFAESETDRRAILAARIIDCFFEDYAEMKTGLPAQEYRRRCIVPGRRILVMKPDGARSATALSVDDRCRLLVQYEDMTTELLCSGEISIKLDI